MFPFTKKKMAPVVSKSETLNESLRRRLEETDARIGKAVRKMQRCVNETIAHPNQLKVVK